MKKLTIQDFEKAAKLLNCQVAAIRAVSEVESKGDGFYSDGFPVILFERHKFYKYTKGKFAALHPEICNRKSGGYGAPGANQRRKFNLAFSLDANAALMSCSWGKFQIMGFNYEVCGFRSVNDFVDAMKKGEGEHLLAFCNFVKGNGLDKFLRSLNWAQFARGYNGADYQKNNYDKKMKAFYQKFSNPRTLASIPTDIPAADTAGNQDASADHHVAPPETPLSSNPAADATAPETDQTDQSKLKEITDKYLKHAKTDSAKNIFLVISARIGTAITGLWTVGITGKIFLILISAVIIGVFAYAFIKYRARLKAWIKAIFDSILNSE